MNGLFVVKKRGLPEGRSLIVSVLSAIRKLSERATGRSSGDGLQLANHPEQPPGRYIAVLATIA